MQRSSLAAPTPDEIAQRFTAHYQPIVDLNTGAVAGFEALARVVESDGSTATAGAGSWMRINKILNGFAP